MPWYWKRYVRNVAPRRRVRGVAQLVAEAVADFRVGVRVEGLVEAAPHRPEERGADVDAAVGGVADVGEEKARGAAVPADGVVDVGRVEDRDPLHLEDRVLRHHLVVHLDAGARGGERPARVGLRAGGELAPLHAVGVVVHPLDAAALDVDARLDEPHRVLEEAPPRLVHLDPVPGEALLATDEDDVALGHEPALHAAVGLDVLVDVRLVGLDPHGAHAQVDRAPPRKVALLQLLLGLGPDPQLARVGGRLHRRGGRDGRRRGRRRRGSRGGGRSLAPGGGAAQDDHGEDEQRKGPGQGAFR